MPEVNKYSLFSPFFFPSKGKKCLFTSSIMMVNGSSSGESMDMNMSTPKVTWIRWLGQDAKQRNKLKQLMPMGIVAVGMKEATSLMGTSL
jgi:hypothetical protein